MFHMSWLERLPGPAQTLGNTHLTGYVRWSLETTVEYGSGRIAGHDVADRSHEQGGVLSSSRVEVHHQGDHFSPGDFYCILPRGADARGVPAISGFNYYSPVGKVRRTLHLQSNCNVDFDPRSRQLPIAHISVSVSDGQHASIALRPDVHSAAWANRIEVEIAAA